MNKLLKTMKRLNALIVILFCCVAMQAQKIVRFMDAEYDTSIAYVTVADDENIIGKANLDGVIRIRKQEGRIIFSHEAYERVEMTYDQIPEIVYLHRRVYELDEVEVRAGLQEHLDPKLFADKRTKSEKQLAAAGSGNGNLLAPVNKWLHNRKSRKERKKEHMEHVLSTYDVIEVQNENK